MLSRWSHKRRLDSEWTRQTWIMMPLFFKSKRSHFISLTKYPIAFSSTLTPKGDFDILTEYAQMNEKVAGSRVSTETWAWTQILIGETGPPPPQPPGPPNSTSPPPKTCSGQLYNESGWLFVSDKLFISDEVDTREWNNGGHFYFQTGQPRSNSL